MKPEVTKRVEDLRQDFASVVGAPFEHFFCPILFVDKSAELCQAHVVNRAFPNASPRWTVQRKDVDNFFGSVFESEFTNLRFNEPGIAAKALLDPDLYRRLRPKILLRGTEVGHFVAKGPVPKRFAELHVDDKEVSVRLGLKIPASSVAVGDESDLQFEVANDIRVPAVVSVLKAAHLTLFALLGYAYALGPGGLFLGQLLGSFYVRNAGNARDDVLRNAAEHFRSFAAMVRPVTSAPAAITGTIDDGWLQFCWLEDADDRVPWGFVIFVRTDRLLNAVLVPSLQHERGASRFLEFLESGASSFDVSIARFEGTCWTVSKERRRVRWPQAKFD